MAKIDTDYKQRIWKIQAKLFELKLFLQIFPNSVFCI